MLLSLFCSLSYPAENRWTSAPGGFMVSPSNLSKTFFCPNAKACPGGLGFKSCGICGGGKGTDATNYLKYLIFNHIWDDDDDDDHDPNQRKFRGWGKLTHQGTVYALRWFLPSPYGRRYACNVHANVCWWLRWRWLRQLQPGEGMAQGVS